MRPYSQELFQLEFVNGTDEIRGRTKQMGAFVIVQNWPGLNIAGPDTAPLFKEKGPPSTLMSSISLSPSEVASDNPINVTQTEVRRCRLTSG